MMTDVSHHSKSYSAREFEIVLKIFAAQKCSQNYSLFFAMQEYVFRIVKLREKVGNINIESLRIIEK